MAVTWIKRSEKVIPDAYHGTSDETSKVILKDGFRQNTDGKGMLAQGVYFWEGSQNTAQWWARERHKQKIIAVLKSEIELGYCLDLTREEHQNEVAKLVNAYEERLRVNITDAQAVTMVAKLARLDTVRVVQYPRKPTTIFKGSNFVRHSRIIICVRNIDCIRGTILSYIGM